VGAASARRRLQGRPPPRANEEFVIEAQELGSGASPRSTSTSRTGPTCRPASGPSRLARKLLSASEWRPPSHAEPSATAERHERAVGAGAAISSRRRRRWPPNDHASQSERGHR
jgi:hypothetical protein